jgi:heme-degrading monooxygenase HmoA
VPVGDPSVLRLFGFQPLGFGADYDARLRRTLLPAFLELPGLRGVCVGRRGPDDSGERMIVSIWESTGAMSVAQGAGGDRLEIETAEEVGACRLESVTLAVDLPFDRAEPAQVLRVFRGQVREGELDLYVEEARNGTLADAAGPHGPVGLYLGPQPPDRVVTVSLWTGWESIEAATHGNIRQPIATSNAARLVGGTATHYEVVPGAAHQLAVERPATP